jgi:hypothetical protein
MARSSHCRLAVAARQLSVAVASQVLHLFKGKCIFSKYTRIYALLNPPPRPPTVGIIFAHELTDDTLAEPRLGSTPH